MDGARSDEELLCEEQLKSISRRLKALVPQGGDTEPTEDEINSLNLLSEQIFQAATQPSLTATHRVAAWNALCGIIDQSLNSRSDRVRSFIWNQRVWDRVLELYLSQSQNARPKSSKQLLATLSTALKKGQDLDDLKIDTSRRLVIGINSEHDHGYTKSCLQALAFFLGRDVLSLATVLDTLPGGSQRADSKPRYSSLEELLSSILSWVGRCDFGSTIGQALSVILDRSEQSGSATNADSPVWLRPLDYAINHSDHLYHGNFEDFRIHVLPVLFKRSLSDYVLFLNRHGLQTFLSGYWIYDDKPDPSDDTLLFEALVSGKELGLLYETGNSTISQNGRSMLLPLHYIERILYMNSTEDRLAGLSLLIISRAVTKPIPSQTFSILKRRLHLFFADTDANFRGEVFSLMQRLIDRIRAATAVLARQEKTDFAASATLLEHIAFLKWLVRFLSWELRPTTSYQRHISALKTLMIVAKSGVDDTVSSGLLSKSALNETKWPFCVPIMTTGLQRHLLDLLMDPFDDVRQTAAAILSIYANPYQQTEKNDSREELIRLIDRAEGTMLATGRADHADGVAHMYHLLFRLSDQVSPMVSENRSHSQSVINHLTERLESMLDTAGQSLAKAANRYPVHGLLTSIRYTTTQGENGFNAEKLARCLHRVWETVKPVLCNDAPEGFVPEDMEDIQDVTTKDTLSYCWRALKESSLLLGVLINHKMVHEKMAVDLSNLCFTQLAELRHRGAFSTVAQTWISCCLRCRDVEVAGGTALQSWYRGVLDSLRNKTTINTRRSAGLPSLICGLLIADKTGKTTSQAIHDLTAIARQAVNAETANESSLPQVHALNCTKDILKSTRLSEYSECFVSHAFLLAAESLRSEAWAIRNCGLMLFRAAIDRLLGTSEAHLDEDAAPRHKISLANQPELIDAIYDLLKPNQEPTAAAGMGGSEGVFPALQLLQRIQIPNVRRQEALAAVLHLTSSSSWHVRDKAARTYAVILDTDMIEAEIWQSIGAKHANLNAQHGALLCAKYLVMRSNRDYDESSRRDLKPSAKEKSTRQDGDDGKWLSFLQSTSQVHLKSACPLIRAAFLDVLLACLQSRSFFGEYNAMMHAFMELVRSLELENVVVCSGPGEGALRQSSGRLLAYQILSIDMKPHGNVPTNLISGLAETDADACRAFFREAYSVESGNAKYSNDGLCAGFLLVKDILAGDNDTGLKREAQRFLLGYSDHHLLNIESELSAFFFDAVQSAPPPLAYGSNQTYADQWLQLHAIKLQYDASNEPEDIPEGTDEAISNFISSCKHAIQTEQSSLFSREAAVEAFRRIDGLWDRTKLDRPHEFMELCFGIYDLLNDDDEEHRQEATQNVSRILDPKPGVHRLREPISSSQSLVDMMLKRWSNKSGFAAEAVARAFSISETEHVSSVADQLAAYSNVDTALFVEEKQNLYVDEARETRLWSQVVSKLQPTCISRKLSRRLVGWVSEGLDQLTNKAESEKDGPLGWSTKPDIFRLGLQVIYGAEALLVLAERGLRLSVPPSSLRLNLGKLLQVARAQKLNVLWVNEMDRIMTRAIRARVAMQHTILEHLMFRN